MEEPSLALSPHGLDCGLHSSGLAPHTEGDNLRGLIQHAVNAVEGVPVRDYVRQGHHHRPSGRWCVSVRDQRYSEQQLGTAHRLRSLPDEVLACQPLHVLVGRTAAQRTYPRANSLECLAAAIAGIVEGRPAVASPPVEPAR